MSKLITRVGMLAAVGMFAVALTFGARQAFASTATAWCDTPDNVCRDDDDCYGACYYFVGTVNGGGCLPSGCCMCLY